MNDRRISSGEFVWRNKLSYERNEGMITVELFFCHNRCHWIHWQHIRMWQWRSEMKQGNIQMDRVLFHVQENVLESPLYLLVSQ
jgi:hypothetical protein